MKTLLPCPACSQYFLPPRFARQQSLLRCPDCGHELRLESLVVELAVDAPQWSLVDPTGEEGFFIDDSQATNIFGAIDEDHQPSDSQGLDIGHAHVESSPWVRSENVPLSNEWELQSLKSNEEIVSNEEIAGNDASEFAPNQDETSSAQEISNAESVAESVHAESFNVEVSFEDEILLDESGHLITLQPTESKLRRHERFPLRESIDADPFGISTATPRRRRKDSSIRFFFEVAGGAVAAILIATAILWFGFKTDPYKAGPIVAKYLPWIVPPQFTGDAVPNPFPKVSRPSQSSEVGMGGQESSTTSSTKTPTQSLPRVMSEDTSSPEDVNKQSDGNKQSDAAEPSESMAASDPSQAFQSLEAAMTLDMSDTANVATLYESLCIVGEELAELNRSESAAFRTWQQAAMKTAKPLSKDKLLLQELGKIAQSKSVTTNQLPSNRTGRLNFIQIAEVVTTDLGQEWLPNKPNEASKARWKNTSLFVPKSVGIQGVENQKYLVIGESELTTNDNSQSTAVFTLVLAIPF